MAQGKSRIEKLQREREHVEKLFSDRINFYLVFAAAIFIFLLDKNHCNTYARPILISICLISALMLLALLRTYLLVRRVLKEIKEYHEEEVYSNFANAVKCFPPDANITLLCVPIVLLAYFVYALALSFF